ncbi:MAG: thiamine diphosphokinase [Aurantimonas endophytica]|uniref:Thiamine diphosphokinase n=1 Tax=Aurantimonas endophytica TaxID=1522175 RepID=A0A7W6HHS6_9HYPH|nr:thiamine diphosphokinase [Aurantimonas endophytica]MBB4005500.1 thiamine pyrophosphokinase [Aurantimonas endophytica]MCO6406525.1 thiamine diphosphokinase [Aurantimonas endophytica]
MSRFAILLAGRVDPTPALRAALSGSRIIAADDGLRHAVSLGVTPELWVGDFDSSPPTPPAGFADLPRETFPADKDRTDGELAIDAALARGATSLMLVGALGGPRSDHAFAHLILALRYAAAGVAVECYDGFEQAWPLSPAPRRFDLLPGTQFSILKFSDLAGLTIAGAKWPLDEVSVPFHSILTQSNEAAGPITVTVREGAAILIAQADPSVR